MSANWNGLYKVANIPYVCALMTAHAPTALRGTKEATSQRNTHTSHRQKEMTDRRTGHHSITNTLHTTTTDKERKHSNLTQCTTNRLENKSTEELCSNPQRYSKFKAQLVQASLIICLL